MTKPADHEERMERALTALDGLSVGDAFGERFFGWPPEVATAVVANREMRESWWRYTDDTEMAIAIVEVLRSHGRIDQDQLARAFADRYARDDRRGYGAGAHWLLTQLGNGVSWREAAPAMFGGTGSMGNGGAMRIAPVGAYFADDYDAVAEQAARSAEVTHSHPEGQAGAIAVALAAAWAWRNRGRAAQPEAGREMLEFVLARTPDGQTRDGIELAATVTETRLTMVARRLGTGQRVTSPDTVPFCLWVAARHLADYADALWETAAVYGDIDTNCAIVGGIVALSAGPASIPPEWLAAREPLQIE
jgi:ADP-ribosylglycohydrolase